MSLKIVHVCARSVDFSSNGVSGPMDEVVAEPALHDKTSRRVIHFESMQHGTYSFLRAFNGTIPGLPHHVEYTHYFRPRLWSTEARPRDVVVHAFWSLQLRTHVYQDHVTLPNFVILLRRGRIVWVGRVRIHSDNWRVV